MPPRSSASAAARFGRSRVPALHNGDRLNRSEFMRRRHALPEHAAVELIDGVVYAGESGGLPHETRHAQLAVLLGVYEDATKGVTAADRTGVMLGEWSIPQPDLCLRVSGRGARCRPAEDGRLAGPPELVIEVAYNAESIELHGKKDDYRRAGVEEYVVLCVEEDRMRCFDLTANRERAPERDGVFRSRVFPGLWIDAAAVSACDTGLALDVLRQGLDTVEHRAFVKRLRAGSGRNSSAGKK
jgi:Uma2 family endonuclease